MDKLKVLLIGGMEHNISDEMKDRLDYHHIAQDDRSVPNAVYPDAQAVIVIRKFVSHMLSDRGKKIAKVRKIPFVAVRTPNFIIPELVRYGLIEEKKNGHPPPKEAPKAAETAKPSDAHVQKQEDTIGLDIDQLREKYLDRTIDAVRKILKPGEKINEDDLLELLTLPDAAGLPKNDIKELLPDLAVNGVIYNTTGKTWKMPPEDGTLYDFEEDEEEAPRILEEKPVKSKDHVGEQRHSKVYWVELIQGFPEGPYNTQREVFMEGMKYKEFVKVDGTKPADSYYWQILPVAIKLGVVYEKGGKYYVKRDPSVVLTIDDTYKPPKAKKSAKKRPAFGRTAAGSPAKDLVRPASGRPPQKLADRYKIVIPVADVARHVIITAKRVISEAYWDECAARTMARLLRNTHYEAYLKNKEGFTIEEWDRLAWDTLRLMPFGPVFEEVLGKGGIK